MNWLKRNQFSTRPCNAPFYSYAQKNEKNDSKNSTKSLKSVVKLCTILSGLLNEMKEAENRRRKNNSFFACIASNFGLLHTQLYKAIVVMVELPNLPSSCSVHSLFSQCLLYCALLVQMMRRFCMYLKVYWAGHRKAAVDVRELAVVIGDAELKLINASMWWMIELARTAIS